MSINFAAVKTRASEINVDSAGGMDYIFLGKTLPFDRINAKLLLTDDRLQISELNWRDFFRHSAGQRGPFSRRKTTSVIGRR